MIRIFCYSILFTGWAFGPTTPDLQAVPSDRHDLTVTYSIAVKSRRSNTGIGETYNGGIETLFSHAGKMRLRLVSLMRIQSIYILPDSKAPVTLLKESGKNRYKTYLTPEEWKAYNRKYEGLTCNLTDDTMHILNFPCKKATLTLKDGKVITAYYTPSIQDSLQAEAEPAFAAIPGIVLKYEYMNRGKSITYTATMVTRNSIDPDVFAIPGNDFPLRK